LRPDDHPDRGGINEGHLTQVKGDDDFVVRDRTQED
jgi:hypothetical protein